MKQLLRAVLVMAMGCLSLSLYGQGTTTSSMNGKVLDTNGEPLPGATVLAVHTPTGSQYGNVTDAGGFFRIRNMRIGGPYKVTVSFIGYRNYIKNGIFLKLGQTFRLNVTLQDEAVQLESVVVTGSSDEIFDGNRTGSETNVSTEEINALPTANRNLSDFLRLTPQANITETGDGPAISIGGQNNRFNSIYIDGAVNNDVFGLSGSGTNGGQSGISPISIDAIEQFQVAISPFDVTLSGFTGGAVNAVTRSGTNEFEGSVYYLFRNENLAGKTPINNVTDTRRTLDDFSAKTYGFRLGGPIIKNKLFFFVNTEVQRDEISQPFNVSSYGGNTNSLDTINKVRQFFVENYDYDPGGFENNVRERNGDKVIAKIDWDINQSHKLSVRHSYSRAKEIEANQSTNQVINFSNNAEFFPSVTNSTSIQLSSNFGNDYSNKLILGYTAVRDDRGVTGDPFPRIVIEDGGRNSLVIGSDPFSVGNVLEQDVVTLTNNFNIFKGKHTITAGMHHEFYSIFNLFLRENFGVYTYSSLNDFVSGAVPDNYTRTYALLPSPDAQQGDAARGIAAEFSALQLGFYLQDEFQVSNKVKVTGGLRVDIPIFLDDPATNNAFNTGAIPLFEAEGYDLEGAKSGNIPTGNPLFSPRVGFNYDVRGDKTFQLRGGVGIFTSRIPYVWPGGTFTNNGVFLASIDADNPTLQGSGGTPLPFSPNPTDQYINADIEGAGVDRSQIDLFAEDFKYPQVLKISAAADYQLPWNVVASVEATYSKNMNQSLYQNVNVKKPVNVVGQNGASISGPDNRPIYDRVRVTDDFDRVLLATNTNEGYAYDLTASLQKPFQNGFSIGVNYNFGRSRTLFDGTSSQNSSNWRNVEALDKNNLELGFSDFDLGSRVNAFLTYKKSYSNNLATTISLFYNGQSGARYSYTYGRAGGSFFPYRSIGGDDLAGRDFNQLIYIPNDISDINLIQDGDRTPQQQWEELDAFIEEDPYLRENRGQIAERNAARLPFEHILDFKIVQEIKLGAANDKMNKLELTFDIFNFTNFLNKDWGKRRFVNFDNASIINFEGFVDQNNDDYTPQFTFEAPENEIGDLDDTGIRSSRWQAQIGIRYSF